MNGWTESREVEKPKGKREQRKLQAGLALKLSYKLDTDASALQNVTPGSDIVRHLREAADMLRKMAEL